MKLYCKHCGKQIEDTDKFCKYCGGNLSDDESVNQDNIENTETENNITENAQESATLESNPKKGFFARFRKGSRDENGKYVSKTVLEDRVYEERTIIKEKHIDSSEVFPLDDIVLVKHGYKKSLLTRNLILAITCLIVALCLAAVAIISRSIITNGNVAYVVLFGSMIAMFIAFAWFIELFYNFRGLNELKENQIIVKKYGLKKPAELMLNGEVYEVVLATDCSVCNGDVIGDLHIERIADKLVAVCNINRRHIWYIDEKALFESMENNTVKLLNKGEKPTIKKNAESNIAKPVEDTVNANGVDENSEENIK